MKVQPTPVRAVSVAIDAANEPYRGNVSWEKDRALMYRRSEKRAWWVAGSAVVVAMLAIAAVFAQGSLRRVETVAVVVDKLTGASHVETRLSEQTIPAMDALDMHNAARFVRAREAYVWQFLQRDYDTVSRMSSPQVFATYSQQFSGEKDITKEFGSTGEYRVEVINVRVPPGGRSGNKGEVIVTFDKIKKDPTTSQLTKRRYVATLRYEYRPKLLEKEIDRIENPFGFVATAYRADAELIPDTKA